MADLLHRSLADTRPRRFSAPTRRRRQPAVEGLEPRVVLTQTQYGLFDTGLNDLGVALAPGAADPHYSLAVTPEGVAGMSAVVASLRPVSWTANGTTSGWIAPSANQSSQSTSPAGIYRYRTTFTVGSTGGGGTLYGILAVDDGLEAVRLNGVSVALTRIYGPENFASFSLSSGIVSGTNTLEFDVTNAGDSPNPTGFQARGLRINFTPGLTVDQSSITVSPGGRVTNSGSFADPDDDDSVTITSSQGKLTQSGTRSGSFTFNQSNVTSGGTVTITATDRRGGKTTQTFTIATNNPPVLDIVSSASVHVLSGVAIAISPILTVTDPDGPNLTGASVNIAYGYVAGQDHLLFTNQNGITGQFNPATGVLSLTGSATASDYQAALRSVQFQNSRAGSATPGSRSIVFSIARGIQSQGNGHFYEFVAAPGISWTDARTAAAARSNFGLQGYLASITSEAESNFVATKIQASGWLGGSDAAVEGEWRWVDGPEAGQQFWQGRADGSTSSGQYANWSTGQPDNGNGTNQDYLGSPDGTQWNDYGNAGPVAGYLVEYGGSSDDPYRQLVSGLVVVVSNETDPPDVYFPSFPAVLGDSITTIAGAARAGSLIQIFNDSNNDGLIGADDPVVGRQQLGVGQTWYVIAVSLTRDAANHFLVTATNASGLQSNPAVVPTITQDSTPPSVPILTDPTAPYTTVKTEITLSGTGDPNSLAVLYLDSNHNGLFDPSDDPLTRALVGADGRFQFNLYLRLDAATDFLIAGGDSALNLTGFVKVPTITQAKPIRGTLFLDDNANGMIDPGEQPLTDRVVYLDVNRSGKFDEGDLTRTTNRYGRFEFLDSPLGSAPVRELLAENEAHRYVVEQTTVNSSQELQVGVVPISPIFPVPVTPNPFAGQSPTNRYANYAQSLYRAVLGRNGSSAEVDGWVNLQMAGMSNSEVAARFVRSPEHRVDQVASYYASFLNRAADSSSIFWVGKLLEGVSEQRIVEAFLSSDEYQAAHSDETSYVRNLYTDVLGRQASDAEVSVHVTNLLAGRSRAEVAADFVRSPEAYDQIIESFYIAYLHRIREQGTSTAFWTDKLHQNVTITDIAIGILSSPEYLTKGYPTLSDAIDYPV